MISHFSENTIVYIRTQNEMVLGYWNEVCGLMNNDEEPRVSCNFSIASTPLRLAECSSAEKGAETRSG
jgi:hypothetical protein